MPRTFRLIRHEDETGISGTGLIAYGVLWPDGTVTLRWRGNHPSTACWNNLNDVLAIHGHGGKTQVVWDQ